MQKSPCLECERKDQDKDHPICKVCSAKKDYLKSMGGPSASIPVEMTDIANKKFRMKWDNEAIEYLMANINTMTSKQMADHFGVTVPTIYNQLSIRHIKKDSGRSKDLPPARKTVPATGSELPLTVDFSMHGDLYDRFLLFSEENFRTAENQILYLISQAMKVSTP